MLTVGCHPLEPSKVENILSFCLVYFFSVFQQQDFSRCAATVYTVIFAVQYPHDSFHAQVPRCCNVAGPQLMQLVAAG